MRKTYILDTSVLLHDPFSYKSFKDNDVIIPINVLDELDNKKNLINETGKNARVCIRALDAICKTGEIYKGIKIENNIMLKIETNIATSKKFSITSNIVDNKILACAYGYKQKNAKKKIATVLVSKDINLRIRASAFQIAAQDYEKDRMPINELYTGMRNMKSDELGESLSKTGSLDIGCYDELRELELMPNECVYIESMSGRGLSLGRRVGDKLALIKSIKPWGLETRNKEQAFAVDMLCDPKIPLVTLIGKAGTGKTLVAIASALEMVLDKKQFNRMIIYRPIQPVGNDIGYLPGTMEEKLGPWMQAISDSFEFLFESKAGAKWKTTLDRYLDDGSIQMEAITYIRGRSIPNAFILIDESQNLSKEEVKTILTRAGTGTKIVLTGDIEQIDNSYLDATNNGLSYVVEKFKNLDLAGHITFSRGERSILASKASEIL